MINSDKLGGAGDPSPAEDRPPSLPDYRWHLLVCTGPRCAQEGQAEDLMRDLGEMLGELGLSEGGRRVKRTRCSCFAVCRGGPIVVVYPDGAWYQQMNRERLRRVLVEHLIEEHPVDEFLFHRLGSAGDPSPGRCGSE